MQYVLGNMLNGGGINPDGLSLDLQFAADKTLTARRGPTPTFTRASTATFVGSNGLIQSAAVNSPRFDHDPVTLACKGLLIEEGRTNLSLQSGVIVNNSGWAALDVTTAVSGTGLDGNNAYKISEVASINIHALANLGGTGAASATSVVSGTSYTGSVFVKKVTGSVDWVQLTFGSVGFGVLQFANFNISNGTIGNYAGLTAGTVPRIEEFSNGWYRISMTAPATATTSLTSNVALVFTNNTDTTTRAPSYLGSTSNEVLTSLWQFEAGSFPTSYIPTTTGTLARSADVCSITGSDFNTLFNNVEGSVLFIGASAGTAASGAFGTSAFYLDIRSSTSERISLFSANTSRVEIRRNNIDQYASNRPFFINTELKQSIGYSSSQLSSGFNNNISMTSTANIALTMPSVNSFQIGRAGTASNHLNGTISAIRYYRKRLPDAKLAQLTA